MSEKQGRLKIDLRAKFSTIKKFKGVDIPPCIVKGIKAAFWKQDLKTRNIRAFLGNEFKGCKDGLKGSKSIFKQLLKNFCRIAQKYKKSQPLFFVFLNFNYQGTPNKKELWRLT